MLPTLRFAALLGFTLAGLSACKSTNEDLENGPRMVQGEWRLAVTGGGLTGGMTPVPAGQENRLVFGPDSAYARYYNGKLVEASTFQVRTQPSSTGGPDEQLLILKTSNSPSGQPFYYPYYITLLTSSKLNFTTGGGCALNSEYVRVAAGSTSSSL